MRSTAEIGVFRILSEGSSASNVRRIEAVTGPEAVGLLRERDDVLARRRETLRVPAERVVEAAEALRAEARKAARAGRRRRRPSTRRRWPSTPSEVDGAQVLTEAVEAADAKALLDVADRAQGPARRRAAIVLGTAVDGTRAPRRRASPRRSSSAACSAGEVVKVAAQVAGGGGGGRDTMAQAGGRDPDKLAEALAAARAAIEAALA